MSNPRSKGFAHVLILILLVAGIVGGTILVQQKTNWLPKAFDSGGPVRGREGDLWADVVIGQRDFSEIGPREIVPYRVHNPNGVIVDRSVNPGIAYVWDSGNNRILGFNLGKCYAKSSSEPCGADIVIGQPSGYDHGACNGDSGFQNYPQRAKASASTLCGIWEGTHTVLEDKTVANMFVDSFGNLYVPDFFNNRVLKYNKPLINDSVADEVWGQDDFTGNECNKTGDRIEDLYPNPTNSSICFHRPGSGYYSGLGSGVALDNFGNLWVADGGNSRVIRFPKNSATGTIGKTADLVLGQPDLTSFIGGNDLDKFWYPSEVRFDREGKLYVADAANSRVLVFNPPFATGMRASSVFGSELAMGEAFVEPAGLEFDPGNKGIFIYDKAKRRVRLFDFNGRVKTDLSGNKVEFNLGSRTGGSIGIDASGNILLTQDEHGQDIYKFSPDASGKYIQTGSLLRADGVNSASVRRLNNTSLVGVAIAGDQLVAGDGRLLFWNGLNSLTNGKEANGYVGAASFFESKGYTVIKTDANNRVYASRQKAVDVFRAPLTTGAAPIKTITRVRVLGRDQYIELYDVFGLAPSSSGKYLWVSEPIKHRVFRISDPLSDNPVVDIVLGQKNITSQDFPNVRDGNARDYFCNRGEAKAPDEEGFSESTLPDRTMLCYPGMLSIDKKGNLFVSDHSVESAGNWRLLMFSPYIFPNDPAFIGFAFSATKEFPANYRWLPAGSSTHMTFTPAFDSQNRMVVGYNPYSSARFIKYYLDPTKFNPANQSDVSYAQPDGQFKDYYMWPVAAAFDPNDNLYVYDANRSRILIYKKPLVNLSVPLTPSPTPTPVPPTPSPSSPTPSPVLSSSGEGPVACWNFNGSGVALEAPNCNDPGFLMTGLGAMPPYATYIESGGLGRAVKFNGVNHYGMVRDNSVLKPDSAITVSAWFNADDLTRNQKIVSKTEVGDYQISLNENSACDRNTLCFLIRVGSNYKQASVPVSRLSPNTWYFVAGTYDGSNVKLYLNGESKAATPASGKITHSSAPLCVGMEAGPSSCEANPFGGIIDEIKIYDRALSENEVKAEYNAASPDSLIAHWKFDEGRGKTVSNSGSAGGVLGMNLKCSSRICSDPVWSDSGKVGKAVKFNGINEYGMVEDSLFPRPDSAITVSAWFNADDLTRNQKIVSKTESGDYQISLNENSACDRNTLCFLIRVGSNYKQASRPVFQPFSRLYPNTWYFVAGTYDGANVKLYLNGISEAATPASGKITHSSAPLCVGMEAGPSSCKDNPFKGIIDEIKIYDRALSPEEILNEYARIAGLPTLAPPVPTNTPVPPIFTPTPSPRPVPKRVFVTSTEYNGNLGGLSGADAKCQERANTANLGGTWKAWLSNGSVSARSRIALSEGPYQLLDGSTIANNWKVLVRGDLQRSLNLTENKAVKNTFVWTNTSEKGGIIGTSGVADCGDWRTSTTVGDKIAYSWVGYSGFSFDQWTNFVDDLCSKQFSLYCFEQ